MNYPLQLKTILKASGWSQEQLAHELGVSFATLNSWVNKRSQPRRKALFSIEKLYLDVVGADSVNDTDLQKSKLDALKLTTSPKILSKKDTLNKLTLYLTYHTNVIEGSTMTLSDVEDVIFEHKVLSNRTAVEQAEARNHQATLHWLIGQITDTGKRFVIDERLILEIHLRLMNGILSDAGQYRKHSVRIMGSKTALANWVKIPELMAMFVNRMKKPPADIIGHLAETHAKFEQIHPFSDGNGRTGRLLLLVQALQAGLVPPLIVKERKYAYYKYLEAAQTRQDYAPLELFIAQSIQFSHKLLQR